MNTKSAFVSILGRPNVGKSTLLNALVGEKVAIVSPKPQTTRNRITGILTVEENQYVFIDTPGMHTPKNKLGKYMVSQVREGMLDVDVAVLVSEPTGPVHPIEEGLLKRLHDQKVPVILALNKIDALPRKEVLMEKIEAFSALHRFEEVVPISALRNDGTDLLMRAVSRFAKPGPHYFDADTFTEQPERVLVSELVREQLLRNLQEEVPHGTAVVVERMSEREGGAMMDISITIYCERDSHKGIVIGKKGETLKKTASAAREIIESFLGVKVNLQCWVKVRKDWRNQENWLRDLGFH